MITGDGVVAVYLTLKARSRSVMIQGLVNDGREYTICVAALSDHLPGITSFTAHLGELLRAFQFRMSQNYIG